MLLTKYIEKLPKEIVRHILQYTYMPQPPGLLEDIRDYSSTLETVGNAYYNRWIADQGEFEPEDRHWLVNDVMRYLTRNPGHPLKCDMTVVYKVLQRQLLICDLKQARIHAYIYGTMVSERELRRYWGLMLPEERHEMMSIYVLD
jgi:hypothetical protein